ITFSVFQVTTTSITSSYKITATPKNSPEQSIFAQFSGNSVMGSVNALSPNMVYTMRVEAMDNTGNVLSCAELERSSCT
ncbi:unnamed protein product, partial [Coregonus sp. 'balchen']